MSTSPVTHPIARMRRPATLAVVAFDAMYALIWIGSKVARSNGSKALMTLSRIGRDAGFDSRPLALAGLLFLIATVLIAFCLWRLKFLAVAAALTFSVVVSIVYFGLAIFEAAVDPAAAWTAVPSLFLSLFVHYEALALTARNG